MADSYIPRSDSGARDWMQTFAGRIEAQPDRFGLSPADAKAIRRAVDAYDAAYVLANSVETRTKKTVCEKDQARNSAEQICRQFASLIKMSGGVSDADKIAIGVRPVNRGRSPITCPQTSPLINVIACTPGAQTLWYRDSMTPDSSAKPFGATELQLFVAISDELMAPRDEAKLVGKFTRNPISVSFKAADGGKRATYYGRWVSRRGEVGPWSGPVCMHIAA